MSENKKEKSEIHRFLKEDEGVKYLGERYERHQIIHLNSSFPDLVVVFGNGFYIDWKKYREIYLQFRHNERRVRELNSLLTPVALSFKKELCWDVFREDGDILTPYFFAEFSKHSFFKNYKDARAFALAMYKLSFNDFEIFQYSRIRSREEILQDVEEEKKERCR